MRNALEQFRPAQVFTVEMRDVDADAALLQRYDELVPVLVGQHSEQAPRQLCHYFLDVAEVTQFFTESP